MKYISRSVVEGNGSIVWYPLPLLWGTVCLKTGGSEPAQGQSHFRVFLPGRQIVMPFLAVGFILDSRLTVESCRKKVGWPAGVDRPRPITSDRSIDIVGLMQISFISNP